MFYLIVAAAVGVSTPAADHGLTTVKANEVPAQSLTTYDVRRMSYNVRTWEAELRSDVTVHFGTFEGLEACKSARADLRIAMRDADLSEKIRSNCFESREQVAAK